MAAADLRARHVEEELTAWLLLSRCLGNDGIVALAIDAAGPTLAGIANDLLLACYGAHFLEWTGTPARRAARIIAAVRATRRLPDRPAA